MKFYVDEKERKKHRRILRLKIYGGVAAFFILMIGIGYLIAYSPLFRIKNIESNNRDLTEQLKSYFADQSTIAKILGPDNILVWTDKTDSFVKERPQIAELTIKKDYLNRQVQISAKEREKFGIWCAESASATASSTSTQELAAAECWWFDKSGILFAEAPLIEGELINKIYDSTGRELKIGDKILAENLLGNLLKIFEVLQKSELKMRNLYLQDLSLQEVIAQSPNLPKIYFSLRFSPESVLPAIQSLKESGLGKLDYIDFRVENRAYYKILTK